MGKSIFRLRAVTKIVWVLISHLIFFPLLTFTSKERQKKRGVDYNFDQGTETKRKCSGIDINGLVMGPPLLACLAACALRDAAVVLFLDVATAGKARLNDRARPSRSQVKDAWRRLFLVAAPVDAITLCLARPRPFAHVGPLRARAAPIVGYLELRDEVDGLDVRDEDGDGRDESRG